MALPSPGLRFTLAAGVVAATIFAAPSEVAWGAELVPHQAVYDIRLDKARSGGGVLDARGLSTIELRRNCEGWIVVQRMSTELGLSNDSSMRQVLEYSSWESLDGGKFQFAFRSRTDAETETVSGDAERGEPGKVRFREPDAKALDLPSGTVFPIAHTLELINRAVAGERLVNRQVFDGTEAKAPPRVSAFIGARKEADDHPYGKAGALAKRPGWSIRMAYHDAGSSVAEPNFEVSLLQLDNGVAPYIVLDYQDFSLVLELRRIDALAPEEC